MLRRRAIQVKHLVDSQREVNEGELTAVANLEKLTFRAYALRRSKAKIQYSYTLITYS